MARGAVFLLSLLCLLLLFLSPSLKLWVKDHWEYFLYLSNLITAQKYTNSNLLDTTSPVLRLRNRGEKEVCRDNCTWERSLGNEEYLRRVPQEAEMTLEDTEVVFPIGETLSCLPSTFGYPRDKGESIFPPYIYPNCSSIASDPSERLFLDIEKNRLWLTCPENSTYRVVLGPTDERRLVLRREVEDRWEVLTTPSLPLPTAPFHEFAFSTCSPSSPYMTHATYILRPNMTSYNLAVSRSKSLKPTVSKPITVMLLVVDSYSRKHFYRKMRKTAEYLNSLNSAESQFRVFDFKMHNIIGGNSVANQMPILVDKGVIPDDFEPNKDFAGNKSMWTEFKNNGFMTYFGFEDCDDSFPRKIGRMPEIDHTTNSFYCAVYKFTDCRMSKSSQKQRCIGANMSHHYILNYTKQFTQAYPAAHHWLYVHLSAAHEATGQHAETLDFDLREYLKWLLERNGRETVVLLEADHGMRYGDWYRDVEAFQENRLPVFFVIAGKDVLGRIPNSYDTLNHNTFRLNSKLDLRRTLLYFSRYPYGLPDSPQPVDAVNLFTEKAKDNRTCEELHIPAWHCSCLELQRVEDDGEFREITELLAEYAIAMFNEEAYRPKDMHKGGLCQKLHLASVESTYGVRLSSMTEELKLELSVAESPSFRIEVTFLLTSSYKKLQKDSETADEPMIYNGFRKKAKMLSVMRLDRYVGECEARARAAELNPEVCICRET